MMTSDRMKGITIGLTFFLLPLTYVSSKAKYFLLGAIVILFFYAISSRDFINSSLFLRCGKDNIGLINLLFYILLFWFIFVSIYKGFKFDCIVRIIQIVGCFVTFNLGADSNWNKKTIKNVQKMTLMTVICAFVLWVSRGFPLANYSFIFHNSNTFGALLLTWLFFTLMGETNKKKLIVTTFIGIILLYVSSTRAALMAFVIYLIVYKTLNKEIVHRGMVNLRKWHVFMLLLILVMLAFVIVYPILLNTSIGRQLNELSRAYTGKNFFSGRQGIWENLLALIQKNPIVGYGLDITPEDVTGFNYSSHNFFLQVTLQCGLIGLSLIVFILWRIFCNCLLHCNNEFSINSIAVLFAIIFHENFEVTLTQNCLVAGLQTWFLLGLGCYAGETVVKKRRIVFTVRLLCS